MSNLSDINEIIDNPSPLRFWEIECFFKCPVIGTCLDIKEQKQILKKAGISVKKKSLFEIHESLVGNSEDENHLTRKIDCRLNKKFKKDITAFFHLEEDKFFRLWKSHLKDGKIEGIFWVASIRPDFLIKTRREIFGDIHIQMHLNAEQNRIQRQQIAYQQEENQKLYQRLKDTIKIMRISKKENEKLEKKLSESLRKYATLEKNNVKLESELMELRRDSLIASIQEQNKKLQTEQKKTSRELMNNLQKVNYLEDQNSNLLSKLDKQRDLNGHLRSEMERAATQISSLNQCDETCPSFDLCRKRILIVGGLTKMESLYRRLIEENGGVFDYHDGYMKKGIKCLEDRVKRADIVLCPTNCNSHTACLAVKRLGKKHSTSVKIIASSGLSTISQTLLEHRKLVSIQ
jgi:hypothetical protein